MEQMEAQLGVWGQLGHPLPTSAEHLEGHDSQAWVVSQGFQQIPTLRGSQKKSGVAN